MTDSTTEAMLPNRGVAARALTFVLSVLMGLLMYALLIRPLHDTHIIWAPERRSQDLLVRFRPKPSVHPEIIEVALANENGHEMLAADGEPKGGRAVYATLIRRLAADGARVIVLDAYLPERTTQAADGALWRAMADTGRVFLPIRYNQPDSEPTLTNADLRNLYDLEFSTIHGVRKTVAPVSSMERLTWWRFEPPVWDFTRNAGGGRTAGVGMASDQFKTQDGMVRDIQYVYLTDIVYPPGLPPSNLQRGFDAENVFVPSVVIPAALRMFRVDKNVVAVSLGQNVVFAGDLNPRVILPVDNWGRAPISFAGPPGVIPRISATDVLEDTVKPGTFDGKLVVLGAEHPTDVVRTPMSDRHPRMDITAQALNSVLTRAPLVRMTHMAFVPLLLLAIVAGLLIPAPYRAGRSTLVALLVLALYLVVAIIAAGMGVLLPVFTAAMVVVLAWLFAMVFKVVFPV